MVLGNGLLATTFSSFKNDESVLIFASGVSNSTTTEHSEFEREFKMIKYALENCKSKFVYFSTCSVNDESVNCNPYVLHKLKIENYIKNNYHDYLIFRVSNVVGSSDNKYTILNYLFNAVKNEDKIDVWSLAQRNFIDKDDLHCIVTQLLKNKLSGKTINIASRDSVFVVGIIQAIELFLNKKADYNLIEKGSKLVIDISFISTYLNSIEIEKGSGIKYLENLLVKYYKK